MRSVKQMAEQLPMKLDLCAELMPGQLLVELLGSKRVLVENHCGVTLYKAKEICIRHREGLLRVMGEHMKLARMSKVQLVITGNIQQIILEDVGKE